MNLIYIANGNWAKGRNKIKEIQEEKERQGIKYKQYICGWTEEKIIFEDGETWQIREVRKNVRGIRWEKAWVDNKISLQEYCEIILPKRAYSSKEEAKLF